MLRGVALLAFAFAAARPAEACGPIDTDSGCFTLEQCTAALETRHVDDAFTGCLDGGASRIASGFAKLTPPPVDFLIGLLDAPDPLHRSIAADALGQLGPVARPAVPALIRHVEVSDAKYALGRIGDDTAVPALLAKLGDEDDDSSEAAALAKLGDKGAEALVGVVLDRGRSRNVRSVAADAIEGGVPAALRDGVVRRLRVGLQPGADPDVRDRVLTLLWRFGTDGRAVIADIRKIHAGAAAKEQPHLEALLVRLGDDEAIPSLARRMNEDSLSMIRAHMELSEVGPRARSAVPTLIEVLRSGPWHARPEAAHTLGFIGDERAVPALTLALDSNDWRVVFEGARALRRIGGNARSALPSLRRVAATHWSARVRAQADLASRVLAGDVAAAAAEHEAAARCCGRTDPDVANDHQRDGSVPHAASCAKENHSSDSDWGSTIPPLEFDVGGSWHSLGADPRDRRPRPQFRIPLPPSSAFEHEGARAVFEVDDGWLVGFDRGEWGGEAIFVAVDGRQTRLVDDNVFGFFAVREHIFLLTGLAHGGLEDGTVYELRRVQGAWAAVPVVALPGEPTGARVLDDKLVVATWQNVASVAADGALVLLPCR